MASKKRAAPAKRIIAIIAGSRGEYGYFRPVIKEIEKRKDLDYGIIAANMHVLDTFGSSVKEIEKDRLKVFARVHNTLDGYSHLTMAKSLGIFMLQLPELLEQMGADMVLLAGDRGEQLVGAIVGAHLYKPVAHIQAGEVSGNIDGTTRHAITKFAHIHFASCKDAADRVRKLGEENFRIHDVGAPMLDELVAGFVTPAKEIRKKFKLRSGKPLMLLVFHSVTEETSDMPRQADELMRAVASSFDGDIVAILNNSDAGSRATRERMLSHTLPNMQAHANMTRQDYAGLMAVADVIVGNSSSGIIEAPTFGLPAVNVGDRQYGRMQGANVIDVPAEEGKIAAAIRKALTPAFRAKCRGAKNPYGDGKSAKRIVDVLSSVPIDEKLLVKRITY